METLSAAKEEAGQMKRTILLVDDEENIVRSLVRLLRRDGYKILTANSGKEGLDVLKDNHVGVIISDQRMPEMNGTEFLSQVKELYPDTMRIVLSGYTDLKSVTDSINEGSIYKFLTKPWEDDLLRKNIDEAFRQYELSVENARLQEELSQTNDKLVEANKQLDQDARMQNRFAEINLRSLQIAQEIMENLPMGVVGFDDGGFIAMANLKAHEILFPGMGILIGMSVKQVLPESILSRMEQAGKNAISFDAELGESGLVNVRIGRMGEGSDSEGNIMVLIPEVHDESE